MKLTLPGNKEENTQDLVVKIKVFDLEPVKEEAE